MQLTEVRIENFRCFGANGPLVVPLRKGLNILVGENDAGKTAFIDAIRFALGVRGDAFERLDAQDFFCGRGTTSNRLAIRCTFTEINDEERADLLEWTTITPSADGTPARVELHVNIEAKLQPSGRVYLERRTGPKADGREVEGYLREYLQVTYLRPLRNATSELSAGRRSRLAQILQALPEMRPQRQKAADGGEPTLTDIIARTQQDISTNTTIKALESRLATDFLTPASLEGDILKPRIDIGAQMQFEQLLERLSLDLDPPAGVSERVGRGLGLDNLLFMCAELLLLKADKDGQAPLLLVEEPEAHLHPQLQASVVAMLEKQTFSERAVQVILTTHSPLLAAGADPQSLILFSNGHAFPLAAEHTKLEADDYRFLRRFLDATKANLFFAKGVLIVEGDAEALLIPAIAEKLGRQFTRHGVSVVVVGHTGLFRYARIFQRQLGKDIPVPVACLTDRDIPPAAAKPHLTEGRKTDADLTPTDIAAEVEKRRKPRGGPVEAFVSPFWTLEHDLARCGLIAEVNRAIYRASHRGQKSRTDLDTAADKDLEALRGRGVSDEDLAVDVYMPLLKKTASKSITAEELADIIREMDITPEAFGRRIPTYLVEAIGHVTGSPIFEDTV